MYKRQLLHYPLHSGLRRWVQDLNGFYRGEPAMYEIDFSFEGFDWTDFKDYEQSVISFLRKSRGEREIVLVVCNFTPVPRKRYRVRVPRAGRWSERLNSDSHYYGGSGVGNYGGIHTVSNGYNSHIEIDLPPLGVLFFKYEG